jgi:hypothetical protein
MIARLGRPAIDCNQSGKTSPASASHHSDEPRKAPATSATAKQMGGAAVANDDPAAEPTGPDWPARSVRANYLTSLTSSAPLICVPFLSLPVKPA